MKDQDKSTPKRSTSVSKPSRRKAIQKLAGTSLGIIGLPFIGRVWSKPNSTSIFNDVEKQLDAGMSMLSPQLTSFTTAFPTTFGPTTTFGFTTTLAPTTPGPTTTFGFTTTLAPTTPGPTTTPGFTTPGPTTTSGPTTTPGFTTPGPTTTSGPTTTPGFTTPGPTTTSGPTTTPGFTTPGPTTTSGPTTTPGFPTTPGPTTTALPVPVELSSFELQEENGMVYLYWQTSSELNNQGFEIQISEENKSAKWKKIGFIPGKGTTNVSQYYSYQVGNLSVGTYLFRLKQVDYDGKHDFSPIKSIELKAQKAFEFEKAYPNPFSNETRFHLSVRKSQRVQIKAYSLQGQLVKTIWNGQLEANDRRQFTFNAEELPNGFYVLRVDGEQFTSAQKLRLLR